LNPGLLLELLGVVELLAEGDGELIEARRNEILAGAIVSVGCGVGVMAWLITF
jgi:hypothetical protein